HPLRPPVAPIRAQTLAQTPGAAPAPAAVSDPPPAVASVPTLAVASVPTLAVASVPARAVASVPARAVASVPARGVGLVPLLEWAVRSRLAQWARPIPAAPVGVMAPSVHLELP